MKTLRLIVRTLIKKTQRTYEAYHFTRWERITIKSIALLIILNIFLAGLAFRIHFHSIPEAFAARSETSMSTTGIFGPPVITGTTTLQFIAELRADGASPNVAKQAIRTHFSVPGILVTFDNDNIQVFEYTDAQTAFNEAATLEQYYHPAEQKKSWKHDVHIYIKNSIIVFYMGNNADVLTELSSRLNDARLLFAGNPM